MSERFGVRWYEGYGEHDFVEAGEAAVGSLRELVDALTATLPEVEVFRALVYGRQDTVYWVRDDFGFELFTQEPDVRPQLPGQLR